MSALHNLMTGVGAPASSGSSTKSTQAVRRQRQPGRSRTRTPGLDPGRTRPVAGTCCGSAGHCASSAAIPTTLE